MQESVSYGGWYNIQPAGVSVLFFRKQSLFIVNILKFSFIAQLLISIQYLFFFFAANVQIVHRAGE